MLVFHVAYPKFHKLYVYLHLIKEVECTGKEEAGKLCPQEIMEYKCHDISAACFCCWNKTFCTQYIVPVSAVSAGYMLKSRQSVQTQHLEQSIYKFIPVCAGLTPVKWIRTPFQDREAEPNHSLQEPQHSEVQQ